jgi:ABC-type nitrate/sulfonate/bicarbonate transport system substrate-binding protein
MTDPSPTLPGGLLYYTRCPAPTATGLAVGLGLLAPELRDQHQVRLQALQDVTDTELRRRHFDHGITNLIREGGNIPALWAHSSGVPTRLIGITWLDEYQAVVTRPDSPVRQVADLAGRRIPVPVSPGSVIDVGRASTLRGFERALSTAGLDLSAVQIVDTPPEPALTGPSSRGRGESFDSELDLLDRGEADAVWLKGAAGVAAVRERGLAEVFRIDLDADPLVRVNNGTPRTITARQELIDEQPDLVRTYLRTLLAGPGRVADDRGRLWDVLSGETHQSVEAAETAYVNVAPDSLAPALTPARLRALQHQADFLAGQGFIPSRIDVTAWSADLLSPQAANV